MPLYAEKSLDNIKYQVIHKFSIIFKFTWRNGILQNKI